MKLIYIIFFYLCVSTLAFGQTNYPVPKTTNTRLFYIQHSISTNTYVYDVNVKNDKIDSNSPINVYKIVYEEKGQQIPLTTMQRKLAYGYDAKKISDKQFDFALAGYKFQKMFLLQKEQNYSVETIVNGKKIILDRMFVQLKKTNHSLMPQAEYVLFVGTDAKSGKKITEKYSFKN